MGVCSVAAGSIESVSPRRGDEVEEMVVKQSEVQENVNIHDIQEEASFGENLLDVEGGMRLASLSLLLLLLILSVYLLLFC